MGGDNRVTLNSPLRYHEALTSDPLLSIEIVLSHHL